jgi:putative membrane protein
MDDRVRGLLAGIAATVPMTAVIAAGRAAGWLGSPPPKQISARLAERGDVDDDLSPPAFDAAWFAAHFGFGGLCGAVYSSLRSFLPAAPPAAGLGYGLAVWTVSYGLLLPALGLYPSPRHDRPSRLAVMIAAHAVFGIALAEADRLLAGPDAE